MCHNWSITFDWVSRNIPLTMTRLVNATTVSQAQSKLWLITELTKLNVEINNVGILGGWFAHIIVPLLVDELNAEKIINYEIDFEANKISTKLNRRFKDAGVYDVSNRNVLTQSLPKYYKHDTIINTACEHMFPMWKFRQINPQLNEVLYVLQSTDDDQYEDHINCVSSADELADQAMLADVYYSGSKVLDNGMTRFLVIGR